MKLYCFYCYDKSLEKTEYERLLKSGATQKDIYPMYAITSKKKDMKEFVQERDMNKFILITMDDVDDETRTRFLNGHRSSVLEHYTYTFYPNIKQNNDKSKDIKILSTFAERTAVEDMCESSLMGISDLPFKITNDSVTVNPFIFKDRYLDALRDLEYDDFFKLYLGMEDNNVVQDHGLGEIVPDEEDYLILPDILIDEFRVFIRNFGKYFK